MEKIPILGVGNANAEDVMTSKWRRQWPNQIEKRAVFTGIINLISFSTAKHAKIQVNRGSSTNLIHHLEQQIQTEEVCSIGIG